MRYRFTVLPDGGDPYEVVAATRDIVVWERVGKDRSFSNLARTAHMADLYELCWHAAKRQGLIDCTLGEFERSADLDLLPADEQDEEPDPTPPAQ